MPNPTVSIGVPVYNGAPHLPQALDSLLGQTFSDLELIISDNGSTDGTAAISEAYAARDSRVRYIRQPQNIGAARNWNFVAEQGRGEYFKWASGNDYCDPRMLEKYLAVMTADKSVVLCHSRTSLIDEQTGEPEIYDGDISVTEDRPSDRFETVYRQMVLNNAQSGLIRADVLRRTDGEPLYPHGDLVLMAELALYGKYVLLPEVLFFRRFGRQTSSMRMTSAELGAFFNPQTGKRESFELMRRHRDYFRVVARAQIPFSEKLRTLERVLRHAYWDKARLWEEMRPVRERTSA